MGLKLLLIATAIFRKKKYTLTVHPVLHDSLLRVIAYFGCFGAMITELAPAHAPDKDDVALISALEMELVNSLQINAIHICVCLE